jgi:hypothetical protein
MTTEPTTIKVWTATRHKLKVLAARSNMTMMDLIDQLADRAEQLLDQETRTMNRTDNAWTRRVNELRQMVSDLPDDPTSEADVHYYISSPDFFNTSDFDDDDKDFLFAEMRRQYNLPDPY